jgi:hypothetical protein
LISNGEENGKMSIWKEITKGCTTLFVIGASLAILGPTLKGWAGIDKEPSTASISDEKRVLQEIHGACFPAFGLGRNESTCKLWLRQYRTISHYVYSDGDLFSADGEKPEATPESPKSGKGSGEGAK